jgi:dCMP deaminase
MRISRPQMYMEIAHVVSRRSTCFRLNVGAILVRANTIVSIGYNGQPPGAEHCRGNDCPGRLHCHETIHAEANALNRLAPEIDSASCEIHTTDSPCPDCARLLIKGAVRRVFFQRPYRLREGIELLIQSHIPVYRVTPAGYIIDEESGNLLTAEDIDA